MAQITRSPQVYDVCIIGSGAAGGAAAKVLTEGGLSVVMLEAGPPLDPEKDYKEHLWPYDLSHRGAGVGGKHKGELNDEFLAPNGFWEIEGEPYTSAPGSRFRWFRSRIVGGRTNHWGRITLRYAPVDFRSRSTDGMGDDWPITYEDVAPYYDTVESYIGVFGTKETTLHGDYRQEGLRQAEHSLHSLTHVHSDQTAAWACGVPLLRTVRTRLCHCVELQFQPGTDSGCSGNRPLLVDHQCHGAADRCGKGRESRGRFLHR
jgi:choline dehydrogenase-like flavoprotein